MCWQSISLKDQMRFLWLHLFQFIIFMIMIHWYSRYLTSVDFPLSVKNCLRLWNKKGILELMQKEMLQYFSFLHWEILNYSMCVAALKDKHFLFSSDFWVSQASMFCLPLFILHSWHSSYLWILMILNLKSAFFSIWLLLLQWEELTMRVEWRAQEIVHPPITVHNF